MEFGTDFIESAAEELGVEPQEYIELADEFLQDVTERLNNLSDALRGNQADVAAAIAHTIKGGAAQMLLDHIAGPAAAIEHAAKGGNIFGTETALKAIRSGLDDFRTQLERVTMR